MIKSILPDCNEQTCEGCGQSMCEDLPDCGWDYDTNKCKPSCGKAAGPDATFCPSNICDQPRDSWEPTYPSGWVCCAEPCLDWAPDCGVWPASCYGCYNAFSCTAFEPFCQWQDNTCVPECTHAGGTYRDNSCAVYGEIEIPDVYVDPSVGNYCCRPRDCNENNCADCDFNGCYEIQEGSGRCHWNNQAVICEQMW